MGRIRALGFIKLTRKWHFCPAETTFTRTYRQTLLLLFLIDNFPIPPRSFGPLFNARFYSEPPLFVPEQNAPVPFFVLPSDHRGDRSDADLMPERERERILIRGYGTALHTTGTSFPCFSNRAPGGKRSRNNRISSGTETRASRITKRGRCT